MRTSLELLKKSNGPPSARLIIAPHAAASAFAYHWLARRLAGDIECWGVEYPGRGVLHDLPLATDIPALGESLANHVLSWKGDGVPITLFGHSLGSFVAYEAATCLVRHGYREFRSLIVSAQRGPGVRPRPPLTSMLDDGELRETLRELGSLPQALLDDPEVMAQLLPVLRHDALACELYTPSLRDRLPVALSIYGGDQDAGVTPIDLVAWKSTSSAASNLRIFAGGHFYHVVDQERFVQALDLDMRSGA